MFKPKCSQVKKFHISFFVAMTLILGYLFNIVTFLVTYYYVSTKFLKWLEILKIISDDF